MYRNAGHLLAADFALARVNACSDAETEILCACDYLPGAQDRSRGTVEGGKEAVTRGVDLTAAKTRERVTDGSAVPLEEVAPTSVTE